MNEMNFDRTMIELRETEKEVRSQLMAGLRHIHEHRLWLIRGRKSFTDYCRTELKYDPKEIREIQIKIGSIIPTEKLSSQDPATQKRIDHLKQWRIQKSFGLKLPAYRFINNKTLMDLAAKNPKTIVELETVHGIGPKKAAWFGVELLNILRDNGAPDFIPNIETNSDSQNTQAQQETSARVPWDPKHWFGQMSL